MISALSLGLGKIELGNLFTFIVNSNYNQRVSNTAKDDKRPE